VLHVEDDEHVASATRRLLARHGIEVLSAAGVEEARRVLREADVDGALIDVWLPDGSGFELYAWIQTHRRHLAGRVAFVTGDVVPETTSKHLATMGCPVLVKPFPIAEAVALIERWIGDAAGSRR
jgi:DNA-binding response OmpR family regulator